MAEILPEARMRVVALRRKMAQQDLKRWLRISRKIYLLLLRVLSAKTTGNPHKLDKRIKRMTARIQSKS